MEMTVLTLKKELRTVAEMDMQCWGVAMEVPVTQALGGSSRLFYRLFLK